MTTYVIPNQLTDYNEEYGENLTLEEADARIKQAIDETVESLLDDAFQTFEEQDINYYDNSGVKGLFDLGDFSTAVQRRLESFLK
jgi:hypothetical protein